MDFAPLVGGSLPRLQLLGLPKLADLRPRNPSELSVPRLVLTDGWIVEGGGQCSMGVVGIRLGTQVNGTVS